MQAQPHLHSLWGVVLSLLGEEASQKQQHIAALWSAVAEQGLLTSSHERRALALQLFTALLPLSG